MTLVMFYIAAFVTLLGAVMVLVLPNPIRSALALILSLAGLSVVFLLLHAQFVAVMQVLVYAGAIMVLFIFVIMLLNLEMHEDPRRGAIMTAVATVLFGGVALLLARGLGHTSFARANEASNVIHALPQDFGGVEQVGMLILSDLVLPFEMLSLLLLVAILGAVVIAKKRL